MSNRPCPYCDCADGAHHQDGCYVIAVARFHVQMIAETNNAHLAEHVASMERLAAAWEDVQEASKALAEGPPRQDGASSKETGDLMHETKDRDEAPSVGRIVHYVLEGVESPHADRAAIVTEVYDDETRAAGLIALAVFGFEEILFKPHVRYDAERRPDTWHWPY